MINRVLAKLLNEGFPVPVALTIWGLSVFTALGYIAHWRYQAGVVNQPPTLTEVQLPFLAKSDRFQLVMAIHPKCPCSRASMGELTKIMSRFPMGLDCVVLVYRPKSADTSWTDTDLVHSAEQLPGTKIVEDLDGEYAQRLGMSTSGSVILYSPDGNPQFYGGITAGRSHHGDNIGSDSIRAILTGNVAIERCSPVFGCPIHAEPLSSNGRAI